MDVFEARARFMFSSSAEQKFGSFLAPLLRVSDLEQLDGHKAVTFYDPSNLS